MKELEDRLREEREQMRKDHLKELERLRRQLEEEKKKALEELRRQKDDEIKENQKKFETKMQRLSDEFDYKIK